MFFIDHKNTKKMVSMGVEEQGLLWLIKVDIARLVQ
jgi:hypothetical protein